MTFFSEVVLKDMHLVQEGIDVVQRLKRMFKSESDLLDIKVIAVETKGKVFLTDCSISR